MSTSAATPMRAHERVATRARGTPRRILVIGKYYYPYFGGIEEVTRAYGEKLAAHHDVTVIANSHDGRKGRVRMNDVNVNVLRTNLTISSQPISLALPFEIRSTDYDLIHFHAPNPFAACVLALDLLVRRYRGALVITHHMDIYGRRVLRAIAAPFYNYLARRADWVSVTSPKNAQISADIPRGARIETLPLSIDPTRYPINETSRDAARVWRRESFGDAPLVGFLGRHARYKGLDVLVRALARLEGVHAVIAGEGPYRANAMALAEELGVSSRVHFPGQLSAEEKSRLLMAVDVFAFPSTEVTEAFGVSQLEAMAHGAVVVSTNLPTGVTDVSIDGVTALLAKPGDDQDFADKLQRAILDRVLADGLRARALKHVSDKFVQDVILDKYEELIDAALLSVGRQA